MGLGLSLRIRAMVGIAWPGMARVKVRVRLGRRVRDMVGIAWPGTRLWVRLGFKARVRVKVTVGHKG